MVITGMFLPKDDEREHITYKDPNSKEQGLALVSVVGLKGIKKSGRS